MTVSLKNIRYFVASAHAGQVTRAAVDLNISQSAVTAAVRSLEADLGFDLFSRHSGGVRLTSDGARFLRRAEQVLASVDDAMRLSRQSPAEVSGQLRLGMSYTVSGYFAPPLLSRARRVFPAVEFRLVEGERQWLEDRLLSGDLDMALILTSNLKQRQWLKHRTLVRSRRRLWLPVEHELTNWGSISLSDLRAFPYIALTVDEAFETQKCYWSALGADHLDVVFETSSLEAVRTMVAAGMGITVLSDMVYRPWSLEGQRIERRSLRDPVPAWMWGWHGALV